MARSILVIKLRGMGDAIFSFSAIEKLKEVFPDSEITYFVPPEFKDLFNKLDTEGVEVVTFNIRKPLGYLEFIWFLLSNSFDYIIELDQLGRTRKLFSVLKFFLRSKVFGSRYELNATQGITQHDLDYLKEIFPKEVSQNPKVLFPKFHLKDRLPKNKTLVLSLATSSRFRAWPTENFNKLAHLIAQDFPYLRMISPLTKRGDDLVALSEISKLEWPVQFSVVFPKLEDLPEVIGQSGLFLGHDTGQKHLAVYMGVKTFTFFGPSVPDVWHPYSLEDHPIFFERNVPCRYETKYYCEKKNCGNRICLTRFTPEFVYQSLRKDLERVMNG